LKLLLLRCTNNNIFHFAGGDLEIAVEKVLLRRKLPIPPGWNFEHQTISNNSNHQESIINHQEMGLIRKVITSPMMLACVIFPLRTSPRVMTAAFVITHRHQHSPLAEKTKTRGWHQYTHYHRPLHLTSSSSSSDAIISNNIIAEVDPYSDEAKSNLSNFYKQSNINKDADMDHKKLLRLTEQVLSWNQRLNLISRKDCTPEVVYHRHILPSIALIPLLIHNNTSNSENNTPLKIVDVGTGGGFPGLPLALLLPHCEFTLVDSIQKKLVAVSEMAEGLGVRNVRIHCGRCEEMYTGREGKKEHVGKYDVCLGRSVTALPRFCAWVYPLLKKEKDGDEGRLVYIIGGELEEVVESRIQSETPIDELLHREEGTSDKRALIFLAKDVEKIALESGEKDKIVRSGQGQGQKTSRRKNNTANNGGGLELGKKLAKGAWKKKANDVKKERGYEGFQRFES
jgi:16S rRNA (guanine527-N7)-methyltransferase